MVHRVTSYVRLHFSLCLSFFLPLSLLTDIWSEIVQSDVWYCRERMESLAMRDLPDPLGNPEMQDSVVLPAHLVNLEHLERWAKLASRARLVRPESRVFARSIAPLTEVSSSRMEAAAHDVILVNYGKVRIYWPCTECTNKSTFRVQKN